MTSSGPTVWLIANRRSGTTDEAAIDNARTQIEACAASVTRVIDLSDEELPDAGQDMPDIVASLGGDGTANAVIDRYGTGDGPRLLILPGGTMNLLAALLHGDAPPEEIVEKALTSGRIVTLPLIEGPEFHSLVGVIAGPTAAWGEVREDIRAGDVEALVEDIPAAISATLAGTHVRIAGHDRDHAALFVEPAQQSLLAHDIQAESLGDLASHGWAWLRRDFLGGPTEKVAQARSLTLEEPDGEIDLLVDGERKTARSPLELRWSQCPARFIATVANAGGNG